MIHLCGSRSRNGFTELRAFVIGKWQTVICNLRKSLSVEAAAVSSKMTLNAQVAEGQQTVERVLRVEQVVSPMTVKGSLIRPKRIDEIKATLPDGIERCLQGR